MKIATLGARLLIGGLFVGHGTQKLKGWFGGPGIEGTTGMMGQLGMHPARRNAYAAGAAETVGGALLVVGLGTPVAAAVLTGTMLTAVKKVHLSNGPWVMNQGWEYNAVLIAAALLLAEQGPGRLSLDHALGLERTGPGWALAAAGLGVASAAGTLELAKRATPAA